MKKSEHITSLRAAGKINHELIAIVYSCTTKIPLSNWLILLLVAIIPILILKTIALMLVPEIDLFSYYSITTSLKIVLASLYLTIIGFSFSLIIKPWYVNFKSHVFHSIFIAQVFLTLYFLFRSFINYCLEISNFTIVRISITDFVVVFILLIASTFILSKRVNFNFSIKLLIGVYVGHIKSGLILLYIFFLTLIFITASETPRLSPLSTDPNIHAFFTHLISRFGTGLYEFSENGIQLQRYPSGFSYLNFIWSELTDIDALNIVTIQTSLQLLISLMIICEFVIRKENNKLSTCIIIPLSLIFLILFFFPYGYQPSNFHLEGTARTSILTSYAFLLSFVLIYLSAFFKTSTSDKSRVFSNSLLILSVTYIFVFIVNPINAVIYLLVLMANLFINKKHILRTGLLVFALSILLVADPFVFSSVRSVLRPVDNTSFIKTTSVSELKEPELVERFDDLFNSYSDQFNEVVDFDAISSKASLILVSSLIMVFSIFKIRYQQNNRVFKSYIAQHIILLLGFTICTLFFLFFQASNILGAGYLLQPYFNFSVIQFFFILLLIGFSMVVHDLINQNKIFILILFSFILSLTFYYDTPAKVSARILNPGSLGSVTTDDLNVIKFIENQFNKTTPDNRNYDIYRKSPKTLIFATPVTSGTEKWLFPTNASTVYPLFNTYPPVFFYGFGSENYNFDVYSDLSSGLADFNWLKSNNVSYAFLPSVLSIDNPLVEYIMQNSNIIYQSGNSKFLEIISKNY